MGKDPVDEAKMRKAIWVLNLFAAITLISVGTCGFLIQRFPEEFSTPADEFLIERSIEIAMESGLTQNEGAIEESIVGFFDYISETVGQVTLAGTGALMILTSMFMGRRRFVRERTTQTEFI